MKNFRFNESPVIMLNNVEELGIWHVKDTLLPWVRRLEGEADIKLFGRTNRGKRFTKLNLTAMLRGNAVSQSKLYQTMFDRGIYSVNEIRDLDDKNPIGPDGDKRFVPMNMQLLDKAGELPPTTRVPSAVDPSSPPPPKPTGPLSVREKAEILRPALEATFERVFRREANCYAPLKKKHGGAAVPGVEFDEWYAGFWPRHADYLAEAVEPFLASLVAADTLAALSAAFVATYNQRLQPACLEANGEQMEQRAADETALLVALAAAIEEVEPK